MKKVLFTLIVVILCLGSAIGQQNRMKMTYYFGHLYLHSKINGHPASLVFDTGSPYTCMDSTFLAGSGLQYKMVGFAQLGGAGNNQEKVRIIMDELIYMVDEKEYLSHISPIIQLKPILGDYANGILGIDNMGGKVISIDYLGEQIGFWDQLGDTAGLRKGDHITAINGRSVKEISFEERWTLFDGLSGVTLTIQRGDTLLDISFGFDEPKI